MPRISNETHMDYMREESYDECANNLAIVYSLMPNVLNKVKANFLMEQIKDSSVSVTIKYNLAWMFQFGEANYPQSDEQALKLYGFDNSKIKDSDTSSNDDNENNAKGKRKLFPI